MPPDAPAFSRARRSKQPERMDAELTEVNYLDKVDDAEFAKP